MPIPAPVPDDPLQRALADLQQALRQVPLLLQEAITVMDKSVQACHQITESLALLKTQLQAPADGEADPPHGA